MHANGHSRLILRNHEFHKIWNLFWERTDPEPSGNDRAGNVPFGSNRASFVFPERSLAHHSRMHHNLCPRRSRNVRRDAVGLERLRRSRGWSPASYTMRDEMGVRLLRNVGRVLALRSALRETFEPRHILSRERAAAAHVISKGIRRQPLTYVEF